MTTHAPREDIDEADVEVKKPKRAAAGATAVAVSMKRAISQMGVSRTARTLLRLNQAEGFDCQGCAWPDPDPSHRHTAEFCENGAKAVTEEATKRRVDPAFFRQHSVRELADRTDYWLGQQGRITEPMVLREGATHYEPISWDDAFGLVAGHLNGLASPDEALFYTSGRTSNEAAFAYQLFVRAYGTNNMPDCSNMCHESTSIALAEVIGIGKGSVSLQDVHEAKLIVVIGQNPGTNHPRMLTALEQAKKNGAKILAVNPLKEAGLIKFNNPQKPAGLIGHGTELADEFLPVRINGDLALFQAIGHLLLQTGHVDHDFVQRHTTGFDEWADSLKELDWAAVERATGLSREQIEMAAQMFRDSDATVICWAMGITQHRNAVATIKEITNVALMQGNIGKPGAGLCPVRGHSNVQGDRTMGIWERPPQHFLDAIQAEFGFDPPREHGLDTVESIRALRDGKAKVFIAMGGNFYGRRAGHRRDRAGDAQRRPHGPGVDEAQPLPRRTGQVRADPPGPRPQREGHDRRPRAAGHRRGLHVRGARLQGAAQAGQQAPAQRGGHRLLARAGHAGRPLRHPVGVVPLRLHRDPPSDQPRGAGLRGVRREGGPSRWVRAAAPAA